MKTAYSALATIVTALAAVLATVGAGATSGGLRAIMLVTVAGLVMAAGALLALAVKRGSDETHP